MKIRLQAALPSQRLFLGQFSSPSNSLACLSPLSLSSASKLNEGLLSLLLSNAYPPGDVDCPSRAEILFKCHFKEVFTPQKF